MDVNSSPLRPPVRWMMALALSIAIGACASESRPPRATDHVIAFTTAKGLRVEMLPQAGSGLVASNVFVGAGSTRESDANAGSSHFLEHLLFNGTASRTQEELYAEVDRIGAYNNATTKQEYTHFMMVAPKERLKQALDIQSDMLLHSTLPPEKFEKERGIVVEELRKDEDSADYRRQRVVAEAMYAPTNPYRRAVLGSEATISSLDRDDVLAYYHSQYVPSNMRLLLMGDFDPDVARAAIEELFSAEPGQAAPAPDQTRIDGGSFHTRRLDDEAMAYVLRMPAPTADSPDLGAFRVLVVALASGEASRCFTALDDQGFRPHQLSAAVLHQQGRSSLEISARFDVGTDPRTVTRALLGELATIGDSGIRASEWAPARTTLLSDSIRHLAQLHYYALYEGDRIWHAGAASEERFQRDLENSYPALPAVAKKWFGRAEVEVVAAGPRLEERDTRFRPEEAGWVARSVDGESSKLPGDGRIVDDRPLAEAAEAASVTRLDNGLTVIHRAVPESRMFGMHLWVRDRSAREPANHEGMADLLHRCLPLGAGAYDRSEFDSLLRGIGAELKVTDNDWIPYDDYYTTPSFSFIRMDCVDIYWKEAIRTLALMLQEPKLEQSAIDEERSAMQRRRSRDAVSSRHVADQELRQHLLGNSPLTHEVFGREGSLDDIDARQLQGFALDYLDPGQLVLAVVTNLDREAVLERLDAAFRKSHTDGRPVRSVEPWPLTERSEHIEKAVGAKQSTLRAARIIRIQPEDRWAVLATVRMLSNRMQQEIREVRGLAYSLGISVSFQKERAWIDARVSTQPQNLPEVQSTLGEFWTASGKDFDADELAVAVQGYLGRTRMRRVTALGQAYSLCRDFVVEGDLHFDEAESSGLAAVSLQDVARVRHRYFSPEGPPPPTIWVIAR